jgi:hypothetical protein
MRRQLDGRISGAELTPGQIAGDPTALTNFRAANAATRAKYAFTEPRDNPAAEQFVTNVTNPAAPSTGQETINHVFGGTGGLVTPGGGTNQIIVHLKGHMGNEATDPLAGALGMRSLYGGKGTSEVGDMAPPQFDYTSTSNRIGAQLSGMGGDVTKNLLAPGARDMLSNYRDALDVLSASTKAGPRLNASGTGYVNMMTQKLPAGIGPLVKDIQSTRVARNATQGGAEIVKRAAAGANDAAGLQIRLPRQSTLPPVDPQNPFHSWQPEAWRAGTPLYRAGGAVTPGLLGY